MTPLGFVLPEHYYEEVGTDAFGQSPMGTGPYRLTSFDPSVSLTAEAYDDYWNGPVPAASLTFQIVPEFSTRFAGLVAGEFDVIVSIPADQVEQVRGTEGVEVMEKSIENYPMFAFNMLETEDLPDNPLTDANLRKAMVTAMDREGIVDALWGDATFVPAPFNYPEYGDYYDPEWEAEYTYDPERARELLAQSDYDGEELTWHITRGFYPNYEVAAEFMVEQWRDVGIDVRIEVVDNFSLAYERPFHLLNMSMSSEFSGDPYRPLWMDWGPESSRATAAHKTWAPTETFLELGPEVRGGAGVRGAPRRLSRPRGRVGGGDAGHVPLAQRGELRDPRRPRLGPGQLRRDHLRQDVLGRRVSPGRIASGSG